ncbi:hypothetical protein [uncultured Cohaesibacter sp.]|uniref:hypothetical protein n=1 Tax=uncultured Cohaesibacter sp. TaxID=1002546 RepID=UPI0029C7F519|nr:hypothetical protein [uncultured Cohaesibacter sp.]
MKQILLAGVSATLLGMTSMAHADTTIELQRFFGACEADYGDVTDVSKAVGECGIITSLVNKFEADNPGITVNVTDRGMARLQPAQRTAGVQCRAGRRLDALFGDFRLFQPWPSDPT